MRYFTSEWWSGGCSDTAPIDEYRAHFKCISGALPPSIVEFEERDTLHDSRLESVTANYREGSLEFTLSGWDRTFTRQVRYSVLFLGVQSFEQSLPTGRDVDSELGDIGYWEYQVQPPHFELCILFASSAELRVLFENVRFTSQPSSGHSSAG